jgi:hypothetical protein
MKMAYAIGERKHLAVGKKQTKKKITQTRKEKSSSRR